MNQDIILVFCDTLAVHLHIRASKWRKRKISERLPNDLYLSLVNESWNPWWKEGLLCKNWESSFNFYLARPLDIGLSLVQLHSVRFLSSHFFYITGFVYYLYVFTLVHFIFLLVYHIVRTGTYCILFGYIHESWWETCVYENVSCGNSAW